MARHNPAELMVGAVVLLVAAGFLTFAVSNTGRSLGQSGYSLHAAFDHVDGISAGSDVRIAGVKIGSVTAVTLDPKTYLADVTFSVQNGIALTSDSSATVATDGLLGAKYIALASGGADDDLKNGGAITITQGSVNLEALLGKYIFGSTGSKSDGAKPDSATHGSGGIAPLK